jgi:hypothetical protein
MLMWYGGVWKLGISWYIMVYPQTWWFRMSVFPLIGNLAGITYFQIQMGMGQNWYTLQNYQWIRGPLVWNLDPWLSLSTGEIRRIWIPPTAFPRNWTYPSVCCMVMYGALVWCQRTVGIYPMSLGCTSLLCFAGCISLVQWFTAHQKGPWGIDTVPGFVGPTAIISPGFA